MDTITNTMHAVLNRRLWFNSALAALTVVAYAAQIGLHSAGMSSLVAAVAFGAFHSVVFGAWLMYQPKRRSARHRSAAA